MATNSGRGNPINASEGPSKVGEGAPPPVSADVKGAVKEAAGQSDGPGVHAQGQDAGAAPAGAKIKTEKELEKERKKAEKAAKFEQKQARAAAHAPKNKEKKTKAQKAEEEALPPYVEETPLGEKKRLRSLDDPQLKAYNPIAVESAWYEWWEKSGFFKPEFTPDGKVKEEGSFVIVIPPPNVTGALHMGHALGNSLQDVMIRWNRMHGKTTLWLPGCDHAGISTQSVVENMLWRRQGKTRHDLGRKKFVETVWEWKEDYHKRINNAQRKMGGSTDWSREAFTMDKNLSAAVTETFVKLHEEGTIYRANRLVNWCTKLNTALSNLEVINKELTGRTLLDVPGYDKKVEFGIIVHFKYPIEGTDETIEVATTRPETMLGDTGIAVHPKDERYKHLVGKNAIHPFIPGRLLPIVADDYVDLEFGTGAVKITPAHDPNDFALGQRHKLEFINILTDDGFMNENAGPYKGQKRFDVRYSIQTDLKERGLYVDKKDNPMKVPLCEKSKDIIEPIMKPQWWMRMKDLAAEAIKVVKNGDIKIKPETAEKSYYRWMEDINDWCLSRQLWWGHQCPVYFAKVEGEAGDRSDDKQWFSGRTEEEARAKAEKALPGKKFTLERDEDVLDTWFSSGLWPFSTLGWPNKTHDLQTLYPTSILETGWDILFFWIARMIMLGLKMVGEIPFREVYCHSLVRDSEGRKMSKSLGNVIDPLDVISGIPLEQLHEKLALGNLHPSEVEKATKYQKTAFPDGIPQCGADALRFCMINYTTGGGDINFDIKVMHGYRKFCNKIYQATKFVLGKLDQDFVPQKTGKLTGKESLAEKWILHKMNIAAKEINESIADREFNKSTLTVYQYWYNHLCDVYIENSKALIQDGSEDEKRSAVDTLYTALDNALRLIHPFMPFLTEELWQRLPRRPGDETPSIMLARYPTFDPELDNPVAEAAYELVQGCSKGIRSLMAEYTLKDEVKVFIQTYDETAHETAVEQVQSIKSLGGKAVTDIEVIPGSQARPAGCVAFPVSSSAAVFLHVKGRVDIDDEISKANKKLEKTRLAIAKQSKLLSDPGYQQKVSADIQEVEKKRLADFESEAKGFEGTIKQFEALKLE
ncbi:tRNA synthetases class I-domain-containing protein [Annulohypoxylon maeteangense]|uniref:tRNA synthetases class I-domain-containing protein n=1 Tax=Annulohypoxylon maeteangense TaxID=1927788 RepID=UPI002008DB3C|nr:tRNA synthetases class I-domain-containing protein [Annulohypoxylon maeteangense]KAI0890620.1 tRNA synthetases class I-domain-containing protein [Annulohypoxylon maeteangense]